MHHLSPHRRFVSPDDRGSVVIPTSRAPASPRKEPLQGTKALKVSKEKPEGDWIAKRTLHQYPHEALGQRFGIAAFIIMIALVLCIALTYFLIDRNQTSEWLGALTILALISTNLLGIFSQVLTGGRSWHGAVALVAVWFCALLAMILAGGW